MLTVSKTQFKIIKRYMEGESFTIASTNERDKWVWEDMQTRGIATFTGGNWEPIEPVRDLYNKDRVFYD